MAEKNDTVNWQEKCSELEGSLQKFRNQAVGIRDSVGVEVVLFFCWKTFSLMQNAKVQLSLLRHSGPVHCFLPKHNEQ